MTHEADERITLEADKSITREAVNTARKSAVLKNTKTLPEPTKKPMSSMNFEDILEIKITECLLPSCANYLSSKPFFSLILKVYPYKKEMFTSWSLENS